MFDALRSACQREGYRGCTFMNAAAENEAGTPVHERTLARKTAVRTRCAAWPADAGAADPDLLARSLTLLLDGGLASGSVDGLPDAPIAAKEAARALVSLSVGQHTDSSDICHSPAISG